MELRAGRLAVHLTVGTGRVSSRRPESRYRCHRLA
ncbi:hypothetical protein SUDANB66_06534 (plasmid) [Streptomyces sp. SudanB66_2053]